MILDGKTLTGTTVLNENLWLANCRVENATIVVTGDVIVEQPCSFYRTALSVSGDLVIRPSTIFDGQIKAKVLASHNELTVEGPVEVDRVLTMADASFTKLKTRIATFNGTVQAEEIDAESVSIDGDLLAKRVWAYNVMCDRGSVLVRDLGQTKVTAPMIANFGDTPLDCMQHTFKWARPMVMDPMSTSITDMVDTGLAALAHHAPSLSPTYESRLRLIQQCADIGSIYEDLYAELKAKYAELTPAGQQFVDCVEIYGFPGNYWRF